MQLMRYINLFAKASGVQTTECFVYNNAIYFAVPDFMMSKALGRDAINVKRISEVLSRKIRIVPLNNKADLDYTSTGALTLNGGTIADLAGNTATLTLASPGAAGSLGVLPSNHGR